MTDGVTVFTAEVVAVIESLRWAAGTPAENIAIFSNSLIFAHINAGTDINFQSRTSLRLLKLFQ